MIKVWNLNLGWRGMPVGWYQEIEREAADALDRAFAEAPLCGVPVLTGGSGPPGQHAGSG